MSENKIKMVCVTVQYKSGTKTSYSADYEYDSSIDEVRSLVKEAFRKESPVGYLNVNNTIINLAQAEAITIETN